MFLPNLLIQLFTLSIYGCIPELSSGCVDMTNSSSTYLGVLIGALIGVIISWWIYYRQKKTTEKQDEVIKKIADLEELHLTLLKKIERLDKQHDKTLRFILNMEERFEKERMKNVKDQ